MEQADICQRGVGRQDWKWESEGLAKEHKCITYRCRQQHGDGQRERGKRVRELGKERENQDICNSVNYKNKVKK